MPLRKKAFENIVGKGENATLPICYYTHPQKALENIVEYIKSSFKALWNI